jgi:hypothetical protein
MTNASAIVQIVTWNDYGEGTIVEPTREYGFRDLGIIQDYRRKHIESAFAYHTNDLSLALRQYNLRQQYGTNSTVSAELDQAFTGMISGSLADAKVILSRLESNHSPIEKNDAVGPSR